MVIGYKLPSYAMNDASLSGYKPAGDWLEMLPWILPTTLNAEYFPSDTNEMKGNDLWLNVQGNYIYIYTLCLKIFLNLC